MSTDSHILTELNSDLDALEHISDDITDEHAVVQSFCKTLESAFRHGLLRDSKECCDFFDVVLALYNQQNTFGRKLKFNFDFEFSIIHIRTIKIIFIIVAHYKRNMKLT